ncbi:unnamed protein product [Mucor fragilis]
MDGWIDAFKTSCACWMMEKIALDWIYKCQRARGTSQRSAAQHDHGFNSTLSSSVFADSDTIHLYSLRNVKSNTLLQSLVVPERNHFQHIIRLLNTNVDGRVKIQIALTSVKGVGRRFANIACKKADIDLTKRAGELSSEELERIVTILQNPAQYKIPAWFLNRQKDIVDGKSSQVISNVLDTKYRDDLERLKKIRNHRGLRHYWGVRVRGQHTKTTGRRGRTVGVSKKK